MQGEAELTSFRTRAGRAGVRAALSIDESVGRCHNSLVEPSPIQAADPGGNHPELSINLTSNIHPTLVIP